jgi:iron(III) transport system permease protein
VTTSQKLAEVKDPLPPAAGTRGSGAQVRRAWLGRGWHLLLVLVFAVLLVPPLVVLIFSSLKYSGGDLPFDVPGYSWANFSFIYHNPATWHVLGNTAIYVGGSLLLGLTLSLSLTYLIERTDVPGRRFFRVAILSPMAVPAIVLAIAWTFVANPSNGPLSQWVGAITGLRPDIYTLAGMILVTGLVTVPGSYLLISPHFARFDASLEDAAAASGARWATRTRRVLLPMLWPAIFSSGMILVVLSLEAFDVPAILGFPRNTYVFSTLIQQQLQPPDGQTNYGGASAYGVLLVIVAIVLSVVYRRQVKSSDRFRTVTGKGFRPATVSLGRWRWAATAGLGVYVILALLLPLLVLVLASLMPYFSFSAAAFNQISFAAYNRIFHSQVVIQGFEHTLVIMVVTAVIVTLLSYAAAWASSQRKFRGASMLVEGSFLALGVPGVVLGLTLLLIYLTLPIPLYGTVWILVVAYVTRFLAYGVRLMDAAFRQLDPSLYEAGQATGASALAIQLKVIAPLMAPAAGRTFLWALIRCLAELPIALILTSNANNQTLPVVLWDLFTTGIQVPDASAIAVLMVLISGIAVLLLSLTDNRVKKGGIDLDVADV